MKQTLIFVRHSKGVSKKGQPYDMLEVSDGLSTFVLNVTPEVSQFIEDSGFKERDEIQVVTHVSTSYGSLRGTVVDIS